MGTPVVSSDSVVLGQPLNEPFAEVVDVCKDFQSHRCFLAVNDVFMQSSVRMFIVHTRLNNVEAPVVWEDTNWYTCESC